MQIKKLIFIAFVVILSGAFIFAQRPPRQNGPPQGPERNGRPRAPRADKPEMGKQEKGPDRLKQIDTNKNQKIEFNEFQTAADLVFRQMDKDGNGTIDESENRRGPEGFRPKENDVPPFLFFDRQESEISKSYLSEGLRERFNEIDKNGDGVIDRNEIDVVRPRFGERSGDNRPPMPPTARFMGAEMRFGDKLVKGAPFSAEIVIENTRRLFDGTTVTKSSEGAIYRDSTGRTRREQTLDAIAGFSIGEPQKLIFINDFATGRNFFIDVNRRIVRQNNIMGNRPERPEFQPKDGKTESLGTKVLEGISVEGTRTTFEIPIGEIGNDKPIQVVTEKWYSPELQLVVMSKHTDPMAGEQIFRFVNVKLGEPSADLFSAPKDFKIEK